MLEDSPPLDRWFPVFAARSHCAWLDGECPGAGAEWSILACDPAETREGPEEGLLPWLDETLARIGTADAAGPPFRGGVIGCFDYPAVVPSYPPDGPLELSGWLGLYDRALVGHLPSGRVWAVLGEWVPGGETELDRWLRNLGPPPDEAGGPVPVRASRPVADRPAAVYREGVRAIRGWIAAGDIYQANLSRRFRSDVEEGGAADLYRILRRENPAPYSAYLDRGERRLLSSSPELFLRLDRDGRVRTRPIKGTRPRSAIAEEDALLARRLRENAKERAELLMIVDMERNDLGRVCRTGSVRAERDFAVESFASVHHLVGDVTGRLRPGVRWTDLFAASFPGGSITGAPKRRAMEIIAEREASARNGFCGSIGYASACGGGSWNIAIRTLEWEGRTVEFGVGAGIVWDSDPEAEYRETLDKARKLFAALGWPLPQDEE